MNLLTKLLFTIVLFISVTSSSFAQKPNKNAKQIEAIKFGYLSGRLNLTAEESQAFWPLYKQYQTEINALLKQKRQARLDNNSSPEKAVDDDFYFESKLLELKKEYRKSFGKVLSSEKLKKLYQAERSFREELIKQLKNRPRGD